MARQYATAAELAAYPGGDQVEAGQADLLLRATSAVVDRLLVGRVYDVDADSLPTDPDVAATLRDAACAVAVEAQATGTATVGGTQEWDAVGIGSVSLSGRKSSAGAAVVAGFPVPPLVLAALASVGRLEVWT